jgi:two-component SAPR family response regulator
MLGKLMVRAQAQIIWKRMLFSLFLEILMQGMDGLTFAETICQKIQVVFTSAFSEYAENIMR